MVFLLRILTDEFFSVIDPKEFQKRFFKWIQLERVYTNKLNSKVREVVIFLNVCIKIS